MTLSASDMVLLRPEDRTLPRMLERQATRYGDRKLLACGDDSWTFRDARDIAAGRGASLRAAGVSAGDRVAILCSNRVEMLEIILGCGWIGAIAVPINTAAMGPQIGYYSVEQRRVSVSDRGAIRRTAGACHRRYGVAAFDLGDRRRCRTERWRIR